MTALPFVSALGPSMEMVSPRVRQHFSQPLGTRRYRGVMRRVWRRGGIRGRLAGPFLWLGKFMHTLFSDTGENVPFELENTVRALPDGRASMTWVRRFHFAAGARQFDGLVVFDPSRRTIVDWLGRTGHLEVVLHAAVEDGAIVLRSGRQWLKLWRLRLPLPRRFAGSATVREWETPDGTLQIRVTVQNPILGEFFGYEGTFREACA